MKLGELAVAGVVGVLACAGLIWVGIGFAGFALLTALEPNVGLAGAAALTALILLVVPVFVVILFGRRGGSPSEKGADSVLSAIAQVARERPVLAMLGAALFGAAEVFLNRTRKKK